MIWTTEKPSCPGWYWWKPEGESNLRPELCWVFYDRIDHECMRVVFYHWNGEVSQTIKLNQFLHTPKWAGPIPEPKEPA